MPGYKRRFVADLGAADRATLRNAVWDGAAWVIQLQNCDALNRLASEHLVQKRRGRWVLTLNEHRHRRLIEQSW